MSATASALSFFITAPNIEDRMTRSSIPIACERCGIRTAPACFGLMLLVAALGPAHAGSLKSTMQSMAATTKAAKTALGSNDTAKAEEVLKAYADEAHSVTALFPDSSQKAQDFRSRFTRFAATATGADPTRFKVAFGSIVSQCRSCHSVYK